MTGPLLVASFFFNFFSRRRRHTRFDCDWSSDVCSSDLVYLRANKFGRLCRIYSPVGTHKDLLGYLVRRLLENGANSSFVNKLADDKTPVDKIVYDPTERINALASKPHPLIPQPRDIYGKWLNSDGLDLSNDHVLKTLKTEMDEVIANASHWVACPI